ncbi:MAG: hypothetical protein IAE90_07905 [Ignavibacteria bacterium]|nr:hypothetical protein [Ignavibacteria bacterium]
MEGTNIQNTGRLWKMVFINHKSPGAVYKFLIVISCLDTCWIPAGYLSAPAEGMTEVPRN